MGNILRLDKFRVTSALIIVQILFGINYVVSKILVGALPPLLWASLRVIIAAVFLVTIACLSGKPAPTLNRKFIIPAIFFSLLGVTLNQGTFLLGLHYTTASNSAVLNTLIPVFTLLFV